MRRYRVNDIGAAMGFLYGSAGNAPQKFDSEYERRVLLSKAGGIDFFGYDVDGKKLNAGPNGPRRPLFASAYVQSKLELKYMIFNLGARFERFDLSALRPANIESPAFNQQLDYIDETQLIETKPANYFLPRLSFAFPMTDRTVFYTQFGKYVQVADVFQVYRGNTILSITVSPVTRPSFIAGFTAKPERTTQYETGIRHAVTDRFAVTVTLFHKSLEDQLRYGFIDAAGKNTHIAGAPIIVGLVNEDFGTIKGLELTFELRRTKRLAAKANYKASSARGTGSAPWLSRAGLATGRFPTITGNLDFNQPHYGSLNVDYRFNQGDGGKILEGSGLNLLFTFTSGHSYTKLQEPRSLGQASPWNVGVRTLLKTLFATPEESRNSSLTPWNFNLDANLSKGFYFKKFTLELYTHVLNVLNTKNKINLYPTTGAPNDDGWIASPLSSGYLSIPDYLEFYKAINLANRWAYTSVTGNDIYGVPRQIRIGLRLEMN